MPAFPLQTPILHQRTRWPGLMLIHVYLWLLCLAGCSAGSSPISNERDYPPGTPANPERLASTMPDGADPQAWWSASILSLVPAEVYPDAGIAREAGRLVEATNRKRLAAGLNPVQVLPALDKVAQAHAMDEAIRNYWNHMTPEGLGSSDRIRASGLGEVTAGAENSAVARPKDSSVEQVVEKFSIHQGHRELLFDPAVQYIGVGIYNYSRDEHVHYVQLLVSF